MLVRNCLGRLWMCLRFGNDGGRFDNQTTTGEIEMINIHTVVRDCDRKIKIFHTLKTCVRVLSHACARVRL